MTFKSIERTSVDFHLDENSTGENNQGIIVVKTIAKPENGNSKAVLSWSAMHLTANSIISANKVGSRLQGGLHPSSG